MTRLGEPRPEGLHRRTSARLAPKISKRRVTPLARPVVLALAMITTTAINAGAAASPACAPDLELDYVCGAPKPEDLIEIPGTRWLIASGFAEGAGLKLVDRPARSLTRWFNGSTGQIAFDKQQFPDCPGPLDANLFNARGLSLRQMAKNRWRLLVINHGGRQSIEAFDITTGEDPPVLRWRGCMPMPGNQVGNAVASFADGTVIATVLTRPGTTIADFVNGRTTGAVWQLRPGARTFTLLTGTQLPGNNGLEVDPDNRHFYVIAFGWHAVLVYDRSDTSAPVARIDAADFMPDNIHWSGSQLLIAGMRLDEPACGGLRQVVDGVADPMLCHRGWVVGKVDLTARRIATIAYGTPQPGFSGLSSAVIAGDELWLGSFQADRLAIVRGWQAAPSTGKGQP